MLTPEQIADGWKPHDGGPCPVKHTGGFWVRYRDGEEYEKIYRGDDPTVWEHHGDANDIIAYKEQSNG